MANVVPILLEWHTHANVLWLMWCRCYLNDIHTHIYIYIYSAYSTWMTHTRKCPMANVVSLLLEWHPHAYIYIYVYIYTVKPERETTPEQGPPPDKDRSKSPREKLLYMFPPNRDPLSTKTRDHLFSSQRPCFTCEQGPLSERHFQVSLFSVWFSVSHNHYFFVRGLKGYIPHTRTCSSGIRL